MKKVIPQNVIAWVDVDSVLVDFYQMFHKHLEVNFGYKIEPNFIPRSWTYDDVLRGHTFEQVFGSLPNNWAADLSVYEGAREFMSELHELGCYVILLTHLPESQKHHRLGNLIKNAIYFDEIFFPYGQPKSQVADMLLPRFESGNGKSIEGFIVDDYFKNIVDVLTLDHVKAGFSLAYPFNEAYKPMVEPQGKDLHLYPTSPQELYEVTLRSVKKRFF